MNISEVAKQTGLSNKMIRDYERAGLIQPAARSEAGYRIYHQQDIDTLSFIKHARDVEFSLAQIETLLKLRNNPNRSSAEVKQLVGSHINTLQTKLNRLQSMIDELQAWHNCCKGNHEPDCAIIKQLSR